MANNFHCIWQAAIAYTYKVWPGVIASSQLLFDRPHDNMNYTLAIFNVYISPSGLAHVTYLLYIAQIKFAKIGDWSQCKNAISSQKNMIICINQLEMFVMCDKTILRVRSNSCYSGRYWQLQNSWHLVKLLWWCNVQRNGTIPWKHTAYSSSLKLNIMFASLNKIVCEIKNLELWYPGVATDPMPAFMTHDPRNVIYL